MRKTCKMQKLAIFNAPYLRNCTSYKKLTKMGNSLALGPQRRMNGISLQCVHCAVGWSE